VANAGFGLGDMALDHDEAVGADRNRIDSGFDQKPREFGSSDSSNSSASISESRSTPSVS